MAISPAPTPPADAPLRDDEVEILVTAEEAFPAFERAVLAAEDRIVAGFRIFDFSTRLRSPEARAVGEDWFDLILHVLRRGVAFQMILSDFDPVIGTELHGGTWRSLRAAVALRELAGPEARLDVRASLHPATVGNLARLALWPSVNGMLSRRVSDVAKQGEAAMGRFMSRHPHLSELFVRAGARLRPRRWPLPQLWPVTHHQKVAAIDGRVAYIGGLDLNDRRWDTRDHDRPADETWHDVQTLARHRLTAAALETHLKEFTDVISGECPPSDLDGRILRTISARPLHRPSLLAPEPILSEIEGALHDAIGRARHSIYVETQFLRDRRICKALAKAAQANPSLELIVVLPAAPEDVAFFGATRSDARFGEYLQAACIRKLRRAFRGRLFVGSPARPVTAQTGGRSTLHGAPIIYVHAKVCVVDDLFGLVGSANLNGRSLRWDTEVALPLHDPAAVATLRHRCIRHWWGDLAATHPDLTAVEGPVRTWQRLAMADARRRPEDRESLILPHLSGPAQRFGQDLPAVPDEMV